MTTSPDNGLRRWVPFASFAFVVLLNIVALVWGAATLKNTVDQTVPSMQRDVREIRDIMRRFEDRLNIQGERISTLEGQHRRDGR